MTFSESFERETQLHSRANTLSEDQSDSDSEQEVNWSRYAGQVQVKPEFQINLTFAHYSKVNGRCLIPSW